MDPVLIGVIAIIVSVVLMFLGLQVAFSMLFVGIVGLMLIRSPAAAFQAVSSDLFQTFGSYGLSVAPLFVTMGFLASFSGIGNSLFVMIDKFIGHIKGGLAVATQLACLGFGTICGSIPAAISAMCSVAYPEMEARNYSNRLSTATIASGAAMAVIIPPSTTLIIFGIATEQSIGRLFLAGIIPGIILAALYVLAIFIMVTKNPDYAPTAPKATWKERVQSVSQGGVLEVVIIFALSIGGMFVGWFTPTEAAAVGALSTLIVTVVEKRIVFADIVNALFRATKLAAMVFLLIAAAMVFGRMVTLSGVPFMLAEFVSSLDVPRWVVMSAIVMIYFVLGLFIDELSMILITIPVFYPIITITLGYDPAWFGIIAVLCMIFGALTPPCGMNLFVIKACLKDIPLMDLYIGIWPFVLSIFILIAILLIFPGLPVFLPNLAMGT